MSGLKIAVIGAGNVAQALGLAWVKAGHEVAFGVRDPASPKHEALTRYPSDQEILVVSTQQAAQSADIVFLAVPWAAALEAVSGLGDLHMKPLVDATNAVRFGGPIVERTLSSELSGAELIQEAAPTAVVVKAFNQYGFEVLGKGAGFPQPPLLLMASDSVEAKATTRTLAVDAGFEPVDAGPLEAARLLEDTARLWMSLSKNPALGRSFSFAIQKLRPTS